MSDETTIHKANFVSLYKFVNITYIYTLKFAHGD